MKRPFSSELALITGMLINSVALMLMIHSELGVSTLSSVPLVFYHLMPILSIGTWTTIIQSATILLLICVTRQPRPGYLISFVIEVLFGFLTDLQGLWISQLGTDFLTRILCFVVGFLSMSVGAALFIQCQLPVMPFDVVIRDLVRYSGKSVLQVKTIYDMACVTITVILSWMFLHRIVGVGPGTVFAMFFTGKLTHTDQQYMLRHLVIEPKTRLGHWLSQLAYVNPRKN